MQPTQFTTADGTLAGLVNGTNPAYSFVPNPRVLFYPVPGVTGTLLFRNGLLVDEYGDYAAGPNYFAMIFDVGTDIVTALLFAAGTYAPTKMRLQNATVRAIGDLNIRLSAQADPAHTEPQPFILFRNGVRLTEGPDYITNGPWVNLVIQQAIQIGDALTMVIDAGGVQATTADGSIIPTGATVIIPTPGGFNIGTFNSTGFNSGGFNGGFLPNTFLLPFSPTQVLVWFNGLLLTPNVDYVLIDNEIITVELFDVGDILTVQMYGGQFQVDSGGGGGTDIEFGGGFNSGGFNTNPFNGGGFGPVPPPPSPIIIFVPADGPIIASSATGSLYFSTASSTWFYRNGLTMTPPFDGFARGNEIMLGPPPETGAIITAEVWTPHPLDQDEPALNLGKLYDNLNGGIVGVLNSINNVFTLNVPLGTEGIPVPVLVTQIVLSRNGVFLTEGFDYRIAGNVITFMGGVYPDAGDILTARVFFQ